MGHFRREQTPGEQKRGMKRVSPQKGFEVDTLNQNGSSVSGNSTETVTYDVIITYDDTAAIARS